MLPSRYEGASHFGTIPVTQFALRSTSTRKRHVLLVGTVPRPQKWGRYGQALAGGPAQGSDRNRGTKALQQSRKSTRSTKTRGGSTESPGAAIVCCWRSSSSGSSLAHLACMLTPCSETHGHTRSMEQCPEFVLDERLYLFWIWRHPSSPFVVIIASPACSSGNIQRCGGLGRGMCNAIGV